MSDDRKTAKILSDLRVALADLLSDAPVRERFRAEVATWCKRVVESGNPEADSVDTGVATRFGSVGSLAMIAALMKRGPQDLDDAYVLLGAIHDAGPHIGRVGQASPVEWDTEAQGISGKDYPRILHWAQHGMWHIVLREVSRLTPEAIQRLPAWLAKVEEKVGGPVNDSQKSRNRDGGDDESPDQGHKSKRGRKKLDEKEARRRLDLIARWKRAKETGIRQKDWCHDEGIRLKDLQRAINWAAQRRRRGDSLP